MSILNNSSAIESGGYNIDRSLRFRSSASAYLSRTPASASNRKTWTWSGWVKRGELGSAQTLFNASDFTGYNEAVIAFMASDILQIYSYIGAYQLQLQTTQVFRDPSAFYHLIISIDTTQATASNRAKLYVNGSQITAFSTATYPVQNYDTYINTTQQHAIGRDSHAGRYFDGYLAEVNFIDGQALTPSSFGQTDAVTGVWQPLKYMGTYGTNGFYLPFSDNTSATTLAYDKSGNGNNWTANNISTTAGATYDSMTDVPTLTSATAANFAVMNPLNQSGSGTATPSNGNLRVTQATDFGQVASTIGMSSGKWYYEHTVTALGGEMSCGIGAILTSSGVIGSVANQYGYYYNGNKSTNGTGTSYGASYTTGDVIGIAYDADVGSITFYKNGTSQGVAFTGITGTMFALACTRTSGGTNISDLNFGQRPFSYTPPTGFKALNTFNLPDPTIKKPNQYMDATTYTATGTTQTITNAGGFQPDLVWIKRRSGVSNHYLMDSVRGASKYLSSDLTSAEGTDANYLTSFNSNGWSMGTSNDGNGNTEVGWQWKKGATPGFDIVTWAGNSTSGRTIAHSLGVAPNMIITKGRTNASSWVVGIGNISGFGVNDYLSLNSTNAKGSSSTFYQAYGSSTFTVGVSAADEMNKTGNNYVSYLFSEVAGFSKFGSYTGNGSTDGPFVYCGFRPKYVMIKRASGSAESWFIFDSTRSPVNYDLLALFPNSSNAETNTWPIDLLSNGLKIRSGNAAPNYADTYIFAAFAENPFKYSLAR